ncbi:MAG: hypothetical protein WDO12_01605 [Pseudomonadota bacterium]
MEDKELTGGCYLLAFFLTRYLNERYGISVRPIVGWVNDGTTPHMTSHAWIESSSGITDISLTKTEHPEIQLSGALLIFGRPIYKGRAAYTYHAERSREALDALRELEEQAPGIVRMKEEEHRFMQTTSLDNALIKEFLDGAPPGHRYADLARLMS